MKLAVPMWWGAVARRARCIAPRYAAARGVASTGVGAQLTGARPRYAMLSEELFQLAVLFGDYIFISRDGAEVLLQSQDFLLKSFDI